MIQDAYIPVVAAVVFRRGRVLLCQRGDGDHLPLLWEFPGGKIDPGESAVEALVRELDEELGVHASIGDQVAEVFHRYPQKRVWLRFFRARIDGDPQPLVHRRLRWLEPARLGELEVPPANAVVVERLLSGELHIH